LESRGRTGARKSIVALLDFSLSAGQQAAAWQSLRENEWAGIQSTAVVLQYNMTNSSSHVHGTPYQSASVAAINSKVTTLRVSDMSALTGNRTMGQLNTCPHHLEHCHSVKYVDHIVNNLTTRIITEQKIVQNKTKEIVRLTKWINNCKCGCAQQSNTLRFYVLVMNIMACATAIYWSIFIVSNPDGRDTLSSFEQMWRQIRRHGITATVCILILFTGPFSFMDTCPHHWSEIPMLVCACTAAALVFIPNLVSICLDKSPMGRLEMILGCIPDPMLTGALADTAKPPPTASDQNVDFKSQGDTDLEMKHSTRPANLTIHRDGTAPDEMGPGVQGTNDNPVLTGH